jgi:glycosyltransferase involved in cell wall biosynthesis
MALKSSKRALYLTPFAPSPLIEGHRKRISSTISVIENLGYTVDLVFLCIDDLWLRKANDPWRRQIESRYPTFQFVYGSRTMERREADWGLDDWFAPEFRNYVQWLSSRNDYDVVFCNYVFLSAALLQFPKSVFKILDTHDRFSARRDLLLQHNSPLEFYHTEMKFEAEGISRADLVISIKEEEGRYFESICDRAVLNLPYVEPSMDEALVRSAEGPSHMFGFFGSPNIINVKNFERFIDVVRKHSADSGDRLDIAVFGGICDRVRAPEDGAFSMGGRVADPADFYRAVECVIVPQEFSTGLKIKVAEALASGLPMIAHRHAMEGFGDVVEGPLACHSFEDMIGCMYGFRDDPEFRENLREIVAAKQEELLVAFDKSCAALGYAVRSHRAEFRYFVDGPELVSNPLYENAVRSAISAFGTDRRTTLVLTRSNDSVGDRLKEMDRMGVHEVQHCCDIAQGEMNHLVESFPGPTLYLDIQGYRCGVQRESCLGDVFFRDVHEFLAVRNGGKLLPPRNDACYVKGWSSRRSQGLDASAVSHIRSLTQKLDLAASPDDFEFTDDVYILCDRKTARRAARLKQLLPAGGRIFAVSDGAGLWDLHSLLLLNRRIPKYVVDLTDGTPCLELYREFLYLNGIPIFGIRSPEPTGSGSSRYLSGQLTDAIATSNISAAPRVRRDGAQWSQSGWTKLETRLAR